MLGALKNSVDWVPRVSPQPFNERHGLLMSASPSMAGDDRGLWALRIPLEHHTPSTLRSRLVRRPESDPIRVTQR